MLGKFKTHMLVLLQWNKSDLMDIFCAYSIVMNVWQARPFIRQPTLLAFCPEYCCNTICDWLSLYHALLHKGKRPLFLINLRWLAAICLTVGTKKCLSWRLCCLEPLLEQSLLLPCLLPARLWRQHIHPPPLAQTPPFLLIIKKKALSIWHCPRLL